MRGTGERRAHSALEMGWTAFRRWWAGAGDNGRSRSWGSRVVMAVLVIAAFALLPAAQAAAENVTVDFAGTGSGTVTSKPAGIDCNNTSGSVEGECVSNFAPFSGTEFTAVPNSNSYFRGWSNTDPFGGVQAGTCGGGEAALVNPCRTSDQLFAYSITATFDVLPDLPVASTGEATPGAESWLRTLQGTVNSEKFKVKDCHFEYGTTTEYGKSTPCVGPDAAELDETSSTPQEVHAETEPLEPETTYHYRLVAANVAGASNGEDRTFTTGPAPAGQCPNEAIRREQGIAVLLLPGCMALEMVSPPHKDNKPVAYPNVSIDGSRVSFSSTAALGENPGGLSLEGTYVASRGSSGWTSQSTWPNPEFSLHWSLLAGRAPSFTPDFSRWFGMGATDAQGQERISQLWEAGLNGFFAPLSDAITPLTDKEGGLPILLVEDAQLRGASADHSHLFFTPGAPVTYFPGDPSPLEEPTVYLARRGSDGSLVLELLQRDRTGNVWGGSCGARLGGMGSVQFAGAPGPNGERSQGAISGDGALTYISAPAAQPQSGACEAKNKLRILERLETPSGTSISPLFASECSRPAWEPCSSIDGNDLYQGASLDQTKVYFTTNRQLVSGDRDGSSSECSVREAVSGCDLYLYDGTRPAGERLVQVSAGEDVAGVHEAGKQADVYNGITAISADGSHVYYVARGVLTDHTNPAGDKAQLGEPNLYMWDAESQVTSFVGTLAAPQGPVGPFGPEDPGDAIFFSDQGEGLWGGQGTWQNNAYPVPVLSAAEGHGEGSGREGGDGHILVFESKAELTPNDRDGRHLDVYRYDADSGTLECLSCAPGSSETEPDSAPFSVDPRGTDEPLGTDFAESGRWVSEDGEEVGFATDEPLSPGDVNASKDSYLWREGQVLRLPGEPFGGTHSSVRLNGPFLSPDGATVAFVTETPLLPQDGDSTGDVYVARVDGGYQNPPAPFLCVPGSNCQSALSAPAPLALASETSSGEGNVKPKTGSAGVRPKHKSCSGPVRRGRKHTHRKRRHPVKRHRKRSKKRVVRCVRSNRRASR